MCLFMRMVDIIEKKRDGQELNMLKLISSLKDIQKVKFLIIKQSALAMAIYFQRYK